MREHFGFFLGIVLVLKSVQFFRDQVFEQKRLFYVCHCIALPMRGYVIGKICLLFILYVHIVCCVYRVILLIL